MMNHDIYQQQHFGLKGITLFTAIITTLFLPQRTIYFLFAGFICFLLFAPYLYVKWLQAFLKMTYFWISFFLLGILFQIPFKNQFYTFFRICLLFGFSTYFVSTINFCKIPKSPLQKTDLKTQFMHYLSMTFQCIPLFMKQYKIEFRKTKSPIVIVEHVFKTCYEEINKQNIENITPAPVPFFSFANFYLSLFLLFLIFLLAL